MRYLFSRYEHVDPEIGIVMEQPTNHVPDIYPYEKVENKESWEMGSCKTYWTRQDVTREVLRYEFNEIEQKWVISWPANLKWWLS